jgi:inner membrane protein
MTTPEHTLVGVHLAFATGLYRSLGWKGVVMAAVASNVPDWDGLPMLIDMQRFEAGHRVWGHSVVSIFAASLVFGWTQAAFDWIGLIGRWASARLPKAIAAPVETTTTRPGSIVALAFASVALMAQIVHLPCDMVVSGGDGLTDWAIEPWWPFSHAAYVFPLIPWGDAGPTVILMAGILMIAKLKSRLATISTLTLFGLLAYLVVRGWMRGVVDF